MYSHTKKVGSVGRYGPRIGRRTRDLVRQIEDSKKENACPNCSRAVKRPASGIWLCRFCGLKFAGGTHFTTTEKKVVMSSSS